MKKTLATILGLALSANVLAQEPNLETEQTSYDQCMSVLSGKKGSKNENRFYDFMESKDGYLLAIKDAKDEFCMISVIDYMGGKPVPVSVRYITKNIDVQDNTDFLSINQENMGRGELPVNRTIFRNNRGYNPTQIEEEIKRTGPMQENILTAIKELKIEPPKNF